MTRHAQAVLAFGDGCAVTVQLTATSHDRHDPAGSLRIDRFCHDGIATETATLTPDQYDFDTGGAHVDAISGTWQVHFAWDKAGKSHTFVLRDDDSHTVVHSAVATVTGTVTDGVTAATGDTATMADVASITRRG